ncbi:glycosyltransferase [Bacteroides nordii]|uniref:glycosyltransferase n=1 Tax=Bacteroides nordii TaxID=291645 RepID=UPI0026DD4F7F|nr:glycosyltransferase [Bacteroides nordii]
MNILFLYLSTIDPEKGGVQRVTNVLSDYFESSGHSVFYLSLLKNSINISKRQSFLPDAKQLISQDNICYFKYFLIENKIDIVINQGGLLHPISELAYFSKSCNVKLISVIHSTPLGDIKNFRYAYFNRGANIPFLKILSTIPAINYLLCLLYRLKYHSFYKKLYDQSDAVLLLSLKFKKEFLSFFFRKIDDKKLRAIANPCSYNTNSYSLMQKKKKLLYVGRVNFKQKRVDLLLQIWKLVCYKFLDWELDIVGGGPELEQAKELAKSLKLININFHGFSDPVSFYKEASIFCMTSSYEGFGMVLTEAMHYGVVPVAFHSFLSVDDIIDNGKNGVLIKPFNLLSYASALEQLMSNTNFRSDLALNAINKSKEFSIDKIGSIWDNLLFSL